MFTNKILDFYKFQIKRFYWNKRRLLKKDISPQIKDSIISRDNKEYLFIHINKTGGHSVLKKIGQRKLHHFTIKEATEELGENRIEGTTTFAFVRNPWARLYSHYAYRRFYRNGHKPSYEMDFKKWLFLMSKGQIHDDPRYFLNCFDWLTLDGSSLFVDFVGKQENFDTDFCKILTFMNIKCNNFNVKNKSHSNLIDAYDADSIKLVEDLFEKDISYFGYKKENIFANSDNYESLI